MIFDKLEVFGFSDAQEQAILSGLLSGEPVLLMGPPGVAKTELVKALGAALREDSKRLHPADPSKWFNYQVYDASKLNFEDLVGYPSVAALQRIPPAVEYIPTPSSIWNKALIAFDELNRCSEDRQSNLFEIIRSRKLHGNDTNNKFIFSTINPYGDAGTVEMGDALVDRHSLYIRLDKFEDMDSKSRRKVIKRVGDVDGVGLSFWGSEESSFKTSDSTVNNKLADIGQELRERLCKAATHYKELKETLEDPITQVIDKLVNAFKEQFKKDDESTRKEATISGRRAASIMRTILACRAIEISFLEEGKELADFQSSMINTIRQSIPIGIGGALKQDVIDRANKLVDSTVRGLWPTIKKGKKTVDIDRIAEAMSTDNPIKILNTCLSVDMNEETRKALFSKLIDKDKYMKSNNFDEPNYRRVQAMLYKLESEVPGIIPTHIKPDITPAQVEECSKDMGLDVSKRYVSLITNIAEEYKKKSPTIHFACKLTLGYYCSDDSLTDDTAIRAALDTQSLAENIEKAIEHHKQNTKSNAKSKNKDTEKEVTEKIF